MSNKTVIKTALACILFFLSMAAVNAWGAELKVGDEAPGYSQDLEMRAKQYSTYFLAGRGIHMEIKKKENEEVEGRPAFIVQMEGENPYRNEKAKSVVYFFKTGEYVVTLVCTQWRPMKDAFDPEPFQQFEAFVNSFKYLKKPFYEEIEERIKNVKG